MHRLEYAVLALHVERRFGAQGREAPLINAVQAAGTEPPTWAAARCFHSCADFFEKSENKTLHLLLSDADAPAVFMR